MRKKHFIWNIISAYISKIASIICSFVLPQLILRTYGSDANGLVSSITQFLSIVALTDMGINVVIQASLYKPLADNDEVEISKILVSASKFFRTIGLLLGVYTVILCFLFPILVDTPFDTIYVVTLVLILSLNSMSQYLFGIVRQQLLCSDQKNYVVSITSTLTVVLNTILCCIFIKLGFELHFVKLTTALCYMINPVIYSAYIKKHYHVDWHMKYEGEPIKQKWNGIAQHVNNYINANTDVIVLTIFSSIRNVSVYSVYRLVLNGVKQILASINSAVQPILGEFWARGEKARFKELFEVYEAAIHTIGTLIYGCTMTLIVPFVKVYTMGIEDANYNVPIFAYLITLALTIEFFCTPYSIVINAIGHFKQSQRSYFITAIINIAVSVICVNSLGLIGVAIGTLVAACYQVAWQGLYFYSAVLDKSVLYFTKQILINILILIIGSFACCFLNNNCINYFQWVLLALQHFLIWFLVVLLCNFILDRKTALKAVYMCKNFMGRKRNDPV